MLNRNKLFEKTREFGYWAFIPLISSLIRTFKNKIATIYWKLHLKSYGKNVIIYRSCNFTSPKRIIMGNNILIQQNNSTGSELPEGILKIKDNVQINANCTFDHSGDIIIEENVLISEGVKIYTHSHGYEPRSIPISYPLIIRQNVWIGAFAMIMHNVSEIGENSIIASGAVVTKSVEPNSIVGGNPAKLIKYLNR